MSCTILGMIPIESVSWRFPYADSNNHHPHSP